MRLISAASLKIFNLKYEVRFLSLEALSQYPSYILKAFWAITILIHIFSELLLDITVYAYFPSYYKYLISISGF